MALYAIGDVQGCYRPLMALLSEIDFDRHNDRLWFTGDLVNRGPESLAVLRWVAELGERGVVVLGNHDLHLLAVAAGAPLGQRDTFTDVLEARDRDELLAWLRHRSLFHDDPDVGFALVHAGLVPQWSVPMARSYAAEAESALRGDRHAELYRHLYGNEPNQWREDLAGWDRLRFIVNVLTRLRYCTRDGHLDFEHKGAPGTQPPELAPWFAWRAADKTGRIIFGHWSALGYVETEAAIGLDTGCVWGDTLTAIRLTGGPRDVYRARCR